MNMDVDVPKSRNQIRLNRREIGYAIIHRRWIASLASNSEAMQAAKNPELKPILEFKGQIQGAVFRVVSSCASHSSQTEASVPSRS